MGYVNGINSEFINIAQPGDVQNDYKNVTLINLIPDIDEFPDMWELPYAETSTEQVLTGDSSFKITWGGTGSKSVIVIHFPEIIAESYYLYVRMYVYGHPKSIGFNTTVKIYYGEDDTVTSAITNPIPGSNEDSWYLWDYAFTPKGAPNRLEINFATVTPNVMYVDGIMAFLSKQPFEDAGYTTYPARSTLMQLPYFKNQLMLSTKLTDKIEIVSAEFVPNPTEINQETTLQVQIKESTQWLKYDPLTCNMIEAGLTFPQGV